MVDINKELKEKVKKGDVSAMNTLALYYSIGIGVKQDHDEAFKLYKLAAERGDGHAMYMLGKYYHTGYGKNRSKQDKAKALELYLKAETTALPDEDRKALYDSIGRIYYDDCMYHGGKDHAKVIEYYEKCCALDGWDIIVCQRLAHFYKHGLGTERNVILAIKYSTMGARPVDSSGAASDAGYIAKLLEEIDVDAAAAEESDENKQILAEATYYIGSWYFDGSREIPHHDEGVKWLSVAAKLGSTDAHYLLGTAYENGDGAEQNIKRAVEHYTFAAERGKAEAQFALARCYLNGEKRDGTESKTVDESVKNSIYADIERAKQLLALAAENGYEPAKHILDELK